jgi:hypothetical protein
MTLGGIVLAWLLFRFLPPPLVLEMSHQASPSAETWMFQQGLAAFCMEMDHKGS